MTAASIPVFILMAAGAAGATAAGESPAPIGSNPPLVDTTTGLIITTLITVVGGGIFAILLKRAKAPANALETQTAADEAQARRIEADAAALRQKELGFQQAAEFIKTSAEASIKMHQEQSVGLRSTITVLTELVESQQRTYAAQNDISVAQAATYESTIARLRERIRALQEQLKTLLEHVRVQQLKIDLLEGAPSVDDTDYPTLSRAELASLQEALHPTTQEIRL